jgi:outer membrane receptor protein involved in Fe transport
MAMPGKKNPVLSSAIMLVLAASVSAVAGTALAQQAAPPAVKLEEITVTGSQIKGALISEALPVSVVSSETIEAFGIDSGDQLLDLIPENGNNFFNEAANISGGVNSARGDIGAFNLRSLGTGNTLVLLNGRRVVNAPNYQTELVGGSFVPVNTANANALPVYGIERVEVLREGASAIYGADAVAGVFNTVLKKDFRGLNLGMRYTDYDNFDRSNQTVYLEFGKDFNEGRSNIGVFASYFDRDRINAQDDPRWANSDFRYRLPTSSKWIDANARLLAADPDNYDDKVDDFRNDSTNSLYGQYDVVRSVSGLGLSGIYTDGSGEFETYPEGEPRCDTAQGWPEPLGYGTCGGRDNQGTYRYNMNENRDLRSDLKRANVFVYLNHEFEGGMEAFTELSWYQSKTNTFRHPSAIVSTEKLRVGAENYWNPFGPVGSPNRLPGLADTQFPGGLQLEIDNYRWAEAPRIVDNDGESWRVLQGLRGSAGEWDWETAVLWNKATADDVTHNRVSASLMQEALDDPTPAAYNPFSGGVDNNIERARIDVYRKSESELTLFDVKASNNDLFGLPAGPVGMVAGYEHRRESFKDDRDPRLDGTITWTDFDGDTYPFISDVINSSPTPDNKGSRNVDSLFTEFSVPVFRNFDIQAALRYEKFSDVGDTTVGKLAFGWRVFEPLLIRGSWSQGFRVPNLVTINEEIVARVNTGLTDYACLYAAQNGGDPGQTTLDCVNSLRRLAQGSEDLNPEKSENWSVGLVIEPVDNLMFAIDYWEIKKTDTIGLLGEENHTLVDLLRRLEAGTGNCAGVGDPAVVRDPNISPEAAAIYTAAGICPGGDIEYINDIYQNLDTRTVRGIDVSADYSLSTKAGRFSLRYAGSFLDTYEQVAGGEAAELLKAQADGLIPLSYPITGFADLIQRDGNPKDRQNITVAWRKGDWGASFSGFRIGSVYQSGLTLIDGTKYVLPAMTTYNATLDYRFDVGGAGVRARFGVNNLTNERAPLADDYFGYLSDVHSDWGRSYYLDLRVSFGGD